MSCGCQSPGSYATCAGFQIFKTDAEGPNGEWAEYYANKVGAPTGRDDATHCDVHSLCRDVILCHRFPYFKSTPGDCPQTTGGGSLAGSISQDLKLGASGVGLGGSIASLVGATGVATALGAVTLGAGLLAIPFAIIQHHDQAVALEQEVLCSVSSAYNQAAAQIEAGVANGTISVDQALTLADQIQSQIVQALQNGYNNCNARCYYTYAIKAVTLFCKERLYPFLAPKAQPAPTPSSVVPNGATIASALASQSPTNIAAIGAAVIGFITGSKLLLFGGIGAFLFSNGNLLPKGTSVISQPIAPSPSIPTYATPPVVAPPIRSIPFNPSANSGIPDIAQQDSPNNNFSRYYIN